MPATVPAEIARRLASGAPAASRSLGRGEARVRPAATSSTSTGWATPIEMGTARRRCTASRIRPSAWPPGCSTTTRAATQLIARVFDGQPEGLTRDDILDNITLYWLTNTAISSARLYWENKLAFFDAEGVTIPVAVSVFPDEIYHGPAELGRAGLSQAHPLQQARQRRPLRGLGAAGALRERDARGVPVAALAVERSGGARTSAARSSAAH